MGKRNIFGVITLSIIFFNCLILSGQKRQGNIVEYFGKEKINEVKEGDVLHLFSNALYLPTNRNALNSLSFPTDKVFKEFLMTQKTVVENEIGVVDHTGTAQRWTQIAVDENSTFSSPKLRGAYVYFSYESSEEQVVLFEASGHTQVLINGFPHEGDYYDFGYSLIPVRLKKGTNVFTMKVGRFPRVRARLIQPKKPVLFTQRDMTLPDLLIEDSMSYKGAIRVINASDSWVKSHQIATEHRDVEINTTIPAIPPMSVRKVAFDIPALATGSAIGKSKIKLKLNDASLVLLDEQEIDIELKSKFGKHKRTFISQIDNSVQYFSVAPSSNKALNNGALFLSVHGASVEAVNQANAYKQKDWGHVVAPTNRRPFGFAWEDWGRLDALEVLEQGKRIYEPDPQKIYLTGHSMGGHGTWYLGATYPDKFAAIAPCAGYPDLLGYRDSFVKRALNASEAELKRWGITPKMLAEMQKKPQLSDMDHMISRAGNPSRTLTLKRNYLQHGIYVLHGEVDNVVPTFIAREMREVLGQFHPDFTYYEYPGGTHWYGDHSMDWPPIFELFKQRSIPMDSTMNKMEFYTASPGVSAKSHFATIEQQEKPFEVSSLTYSKSEYPIFTTANVSGLTLDLSDIIGDAQRIVIDNDSIRVSNASKIHLKQDSGSWKTVETFAKTEKGPHRNGGFKDAFTNQMVFVYATGGTEIENQWYYNKARLDAETFYYRANGSVEMIADKDFKLKDFSDRNIIIYGNSDTNSAWSKLLKNSPVTIESNQVKIGDKTIKGGEWGMYFIVPRPDSDTASVGVVAATGIDGLKAIYSNHYLLNGTSYPDLLLFSNAIMDFGTDAVKCVGFFGNDWSVENGEFVWQ